MKKSLLVFDFDGTIADTLLVALTIINELGQEFNLPQVSKEQLVEFKHKSIPELVKISGLSWFQIPQFIRQARIRFKEHLNQVCPILGMPEILLALRQRGYRMGILTSNTHEGVRLFLDNHHISGFDFIHSPTSLFGKSKVLKHILKSQDLDASDVVMIGDEIRDVEAAHKVGVEAIAVTWGFNSEQLLRTRKPQYLVKQPAELLSLFE